MKTITTKLTNSKINNVSVNDGILDDAEDMHEEILDVAEVIRL